MTDKRKIELFSALLDWICYHCPSDEDVYRALSGLGMTDEEISSCGIDMDFSDEEDGDKI